MRSLIHQQQATTSKEAPRQLSDNCTDIIDMYRSGEILFVDYSENIFFGRWSVDYNFSYAIFPSDVFLKVIMDVLQDKRKQGVKYLCFTREFYQLLRDFYRHYMYMFIGVFRSVYVVSLSIDHCFEKYLTFTHVDALLKTTLHSTYYAKNMVRLYRGQIPKTINVDPLDYEYHMCAFTFNCDVCRDMSRMHVDTGAPFRLHYYCHLVNQATKKTAVQIVFATPDTVPLIPVQHEQQQLQQRLQQQQQQQQREQSMSINLQQEQ